jgi:hypothetical protein
VKSALIALAALPLLFSEASAAVPLDDLQMDAVSAGLCGIDGGSCGIPPGGLSALLSAQETWFRGVTGGAWTISIPFTSLTTNPPDPLEIPIGPL